MPLRSLEKRWKTKKKSNNTKKYLARVVFCRAKYMLLIQCSQHHFTRLSQPFYLRFPSKYGYTFVKKKTFFSLFFFFIPFSFLCAFCSLNLVGVGSDDVGIPIWSMRIGKEASFLPLHSLSTCVCVRYVSCCCCYRSFFYSMFTCDSHILAWFNRQPSESQT